MTRVYKLLTRAEWSEAEATGLFEGSPVDLADGFIHFSTAAQAPETGRRYFSGIADLVIVGFEDTALGAGLTWEPSRGGDLFPHLYGPLPTALAVEVKDVALDADGVPQLSELEA
ncbi:MAG: DUF952 domain-containing protein [Caulobacter sp.]|nr:DUF952 domain-containing protein [Caulobacter sp.]